jgi:DNA modification methylase
MIHLMQGNCTELMQSIDRKNSVIVTDPPFNMNYHYNEYKDKMPEAEYYAWLAKLFRDMPVVCISYPESLYKLAFAMGRTPDKVVSWVYNANTARQHRDIAFWGVTPDFSAVTQPYKNPNDKRIVERIKAGKGARLYDWWNVNQVKNKQKKEIAHPCVMPLEVMSNIVGILPPELTVVDPFMGSGTTGIACAARGRDFVGMELNADYFELAGKRIHAAEQE